MSGLHKVFSDSAFTAIRSIVAVARGIVVIPLITNLLGAGSYGVWVIVLAIIGLLTSTGGVHLHGSLIRYLPQESNSNQTYVDVLAIGFALGIFIASLLISASKFIDLSPFFEGEIGDRFLLVFVLSLLTFSNILFNINVNFPRAKGYVKTYDLLQLARNLLETVVLLIVFTSGGSIIGGLVSLVGVSFSLNFVIISIILIKFTLPLPKLSNFGRYFRYGIPMIPKELSASLLSQTDKYFLLYFLEPTTVGIYAVAQAICKPLVQLTGIFNPTLYPTIAQEWDNENFAEIRNIYKNIFRFYSILGIPAVVGVLVIAESLLTLLSTGYIAKEGLALVPIFIFGYFLKGYDNSIRYILTSAERTDIIGMSVFVAVILNIIMNAILIPQIGMIGAAFATLTSHILLFGIIIYYSHAVIAIKVPWYTIGRSGVAAFVMGAAIHYFDYYIGLNFSLFVYPVFGIIIYFTVLLTIGEFSRSELSRIKAEILY